MIFSARLWFPAGVLMRSPPNRHNGGVRTARAGHRDRGCRSPPVPLPVGSKPKLYTGASPTLLPCEDTHAGAAAPPRLRPSQPGNPAGTGGFARPVRVKRQGINTPNTKIVTLIDDGEPRSSGLAGVGSDVGTGNAEIYLVAANSFARRAIHLQIRVPLLPIRSSTSIKILVDPARGHCYRGSIKPCESRGFGPRRTAQ